MRQAFWRIGITVLAVALPSAAYAQSSITGQVTDNTGGILPGVTVEASSPVLIEGSRLAITDGAGRYTIIDLQPGEYVVTFTLVGFSTQIRDGLTLPGDFTLTVDATMSVGALEETVTVSGQAPVVDVQRVARVETLTRETQEAIPTGGSLWNYAALVPGVKPIRPDVGGSRAMQQSWMFGRGASSRQTTLEVDGMTLNTFLDDGRVKPYNNPQMTQEMSVSTNAMNAETGHGGVPDQHHSPRGREQLQRVALRQHDTRGAVAGQLQRAAAARRRQGGDHAQAGEHLRRPVSGSAGRSGRTGSGSSPRAGSGAPIRRSSTPRTGTARPRSTTTASGASWPG